MFGKIYRKFKYKLLAKRLIKEHAYDRLEFEDRDVLERLILPNILADLNPKRVLDVGREDYQMWYNEFFRGRELWTVDIDPKRSEFGAINHITDDVVNIGKYFRNNYFDFILINGVFGWGLNNPSFIEKTFTSLYQIMKPGGILVLGWNDLDDLTPVKINKIKALKSFEKYFFKPLQASQFRCIGEGRHTYNFFRKAKK